VPAKAQLDMCRLPHWEKVAALQAGAAAREAAASFDASRLADPSERPLLSLPAAQVTLLLREPGRLVVTRARVYFQPLHNLGADTPVRSRALSALAAVARRRHALRPTGLELFFAPPDGAGDAAGGWGGADSVFLAFRTPGERDAAAQALRSQPALPAAAAAASALLEGEAGWLARVQAAWARGDVSNHAYLTFLNAAAGRTTADAAQYPVFPWVLADYTSAALDLRDARHFRDLSKPIGALDQTRLNALRERARQLAAAREPAFLYGTHYSTPGYTLFWLLRALPAHALRLQGGRFDAPDRLFSSVAEAWDSVAHAPADVKELIPEFYAPPQQPPGPSAWLRNGAGLPLGTRQRGAPVGDVALPPWAHGSPERFVATMRSALEAPPASARLHAWVDLIFGAAQRGEAAAARDNVFHPLTYEGGAGDVEGADAAARAAMEAQINEFGQTPRQLFTQPHPARAVRPLAADAPAAGVDAPMQRGGTAELLRLLLAVAGPQAAPEPPMRPPGVAAPTQPASADAARVAAAPGPPPPWREGGGCLMLPRLAVAPAPRAALWRVRAHRGAGTGVALGGDAAYTSGADGWLRVHALADGAALHAAPLGRAPLCCAAVLPLGAGAPAGARPAALAGGADGAVYAVSVDYGALLGRLHAHDDACAALLPLPARGGGALATAGWDGALRLWDLAEGRGLTAPQGADASGRATGGDAVQQAPLGDFAGAADGALWALAADSTGRALFAGGADGAVSAWDVRRAAAAGPAWCVAAAAHGGVCALAAAPDGRAVAAAGEDGAVRLLDARKSGRQAAVAPGGDAPGGAMRCCVFAGASLLAGGPGGTVVAWDAHRAAPNLQLASGAAGAPLPPARAFQGGSAAVRALAFRDRPGAGGARLATLAADGTLRVFAADALSTTEA
jgi:factor associated with neutral sphingomyelinase activation